MIDFLGVLASPKTSNRSLLAFRMPGCGQFTLPLGDKKNEKPMFFLVVKKWHLNIKTKANHGGGGLKSQFCVIFVSGLNFWQLLITLQVFFEVFFWWTCWALVIVWGGWYLLLGRFFWSAFVSLYTWCFQEGCSHHRCGFKSIILNHFPKISTKPDPLIGGSANLL